ncbi:PAS domain-containing sensor histidine kinase [Calothrix sp. 336/3]|uniref:PAS domain-containing sensor histidine kinase n=1 Tax=Calothrix sp. 336/3 TaxID=1337936 RepID=UPI0004E347D0|nr:PAS domain-containing sensor histidine kinase [Calothrix sp. 336/3]AKG20789.1 hypothetical protein IJ00_05230 [Calothrix sp. 336/3]
MSRNQPSSWRNSQSQPLATGTPTRLELVPERTNDLEPCTNEILRQTQEELRWYRQLYEHTPSVCLTLESTGNIVSVNQFGADYLGYKPENLIHLPVEDLFATEEKTRFQELLQNLTNESSFNQIVKAEFRLNCPQSQMQWAKIIAKVLPPEGENYNYILLVLEDVTAYRMAAVTLEANQKAVQAQQEELESLNRLKDEFLSTVSHELRTPLTNMKMAIQMLGIALDQQENLLSTPVFPAAPRSKIGRYFQILNNECDREINLITNFLDLQKLDTTTKPLVLETIHVKPWLLQVVEMFQARHRNCCQHRLHLDIAPDLPHIVSDPFSLERIVIELVTNACKFSPPGEQILISAQSQTQEVVIQVTNYGVEIPPSEIPRIFDKFYRIPSNDPWKQGGTGLGLALVQKLTKYLGGAIAIESENNQTCFTIQLPLWQ